MNDNSKQWRAAIINLIGETLKLFQLQRICTKPSDVLYICTGVDEIYAIPNGNEKPGEAWYDIKVHEVGSKGEQMISIEQYCYDEYRQNRMLMMILEMALSRYKDCI